LVTGASRGIGTAVARRLARAGAAVIVCGRDAERTQRASEELEGLGAVAWPIVLDLADRASIRSTCEEARAMAAEVGPIAWLVNNAGVAVSAPLVAAAGESSDASVDQHMQVNFHGARVVMEALLPGMLERGYGRIVNVASSGGLRGYPYVTAYCASKHALVGYSRAAALELAGSGVCVNLVCPHYVDSPMTEESIQRVVEKTGRREADVRKFFARQNPGGRLVRSDEVAEATSRLLESDASGEVVELDGSDQWLEQLARLPAVR
jgi:NAD(P)-dependent dehydrogenase (short-subunit alcohol dehydrogenase family)